MKNFVKFYSVVLILMIAFALNSCGKKERNTEQEEITSLPDQDGQIVIPNNKTLVPGSTHYVVLLVDTENIKDNSNPEDYCSFPGLGHHPPIDSIKNYTTHVLPGDQIVWLAVSTSNPAEDIVTIQKIKHIKGDSVLGPLKGNKGKFEGTIQTNTKGKKDTYEIKFKVKKNDISKDSFIIDPKIRVH